jgi:hypothetical protein
LNEIAVVTSAFARVRAMNSVSAFTAKKKGYPILQDTYEGLESEVTWKFEHDADEIRTSSFGKRIRRIIIHLVMSRSFFYFGGFLVLFDLVFMCLRSFYASEATLELVGKVQVYHYYFYYFEYTVIMDIPTPSLL